MSFTPLWLGPVIVLAGVLSYFTYFARFAALRDFPWLNLPLVVLGLLLSALGSWIAFRVPGRRRKKILAALAFGFSLSLSSLFGFYVFVLSYALPSPTTETLALTQAPEFELLDQHERPVRLADFRGRKLVLAFYRGHW